MVKSGTKIRHRHRHIKKNKSMKRSTNKNKSINHDKNKNHTEALSIQRASPTTRSLIILEKAKREYDKMLIATDRPLLNRLFRESTMEKLKKLPKELTNIGLYSSQLKKEFKKLKNDKKNRPNQDFYDYVNNEWLLSQDSELKINPKYYVEVDDFRIIQDKVYREVMEYTKTYIKEDPTSQKSKSIHAIANCIQKANKKKGLYHCQEILKHVNEFIDNEDMYGLLAYTNQDEIFSWQAPIVWTVRPDEKNVKKYISHLSPPELGIYDYFIYIDDDADDEKTKKFKKEFRAKYFEFIENTFKKVLPDQYHDFKAQDVWDVELQLLDTMGCNKIKKEDPDFYNVVTDKELDEKYGFNWNEFTKKLGTKTPFPGEYWTSKSSYKTPPSKVIVSSLNALKCTTELLKTNWSTKKWKTYWLFIFYKQMIRFEWDWHEIYYNFYGKYVEGQPVNFPKDIYSIFPLSFCFNTFLTAQYVLHNNNPMAEVYVKNMVEDLKHIFMERLKKNTWLSPSTKKSALHKLQKLEIIIGTPPKLRKDPILNYIEDDPWYNMALLSGWKRNQFIQLEGKDVIDIPEIDWNKFKLVGTQAYMVNAYYRPTSNSIYCPLAYLQQPFIDMDQRGIEYNLAFIGYTMGHELSHSLDDMGSKFDADGNLNNWWTDHDRKIFDGKIKDVVKQYETFAKRDGIDFDASIGVGEDLADISGLALAEEYLYYFQLVHEDIPLVKNLSLEAFYIYSAIQAKQKIYSKAVRAQLKQNPHPLEKYRCNCPLSRLRLFRELYKVKEGDGMYWHNTDIIW
jgi:putative endopeptidase